MKILINYADQGYFKAQKRNIASGIGVGKFDKFIMESRKTLDDSFVSKNHSIMSLPRGAGYWLWKPFIILRALSTIKDDDYLFYCDSGCLFINPIDEIIDMNKEDLDEKGIVLFNTTMWVNTGPPWSDSPEYMWTKRDLFDALNCDTSKITESPQANAATILMQKRNFSIKFIQEWLELCENFHLMTDEPSILPNYEGFKEHRHDQSILSVLAKTKNIKFNGDMTHWGEGRRPKEFKTVIHHDRYKE